MVTTTINGSSILAILMALNFDGLYQILAPFSKANNNWRGAPVSITR